MGASLTKPLLPVGEGWMLDPLPKIFAEKIDFFG
jgi:hypothetical protein